MPITYRIFPASDMTYAAWSGRITNDDVMANFQNYLSDPLYRAGRPEFIDLSAVEAADLRFPDLARLLSTVNAQPFNGPNGTLTSVFAPGDVAWGLSRMYETMASLQEGIVLELSRTELGALKALGRAEVTVAEFVDALERAENGAPPVPEAKAG